MLKRKLPAFTLDPGNRMTLGLAKRVADTVAFKWLESVGAATARRLKLDDRSLSIKFATAPSVMLAMLILAAAFSLAALLDVQSNTHHIAARDMREIRALTSISARFERADGELYRLLVAKGAGAGEADGPSRTAAIKRELDQIHQAIALLRPALSNNGATDRTLADLGRYTNAVNAADAMSDTDPAARVAKLMPMRTGAERVVRDLIAVATGCFAEADAHIASIEQRIRMTVAIVVIVTAAVAIFGIVLTGIVGRATIGSITRIAEATSSLAAADYNIDLDALQRRDELGTIVAALKTFRTQAIEARHIEKEKKALEAKAEAEDARHREATAQAMLATDTQRRETFNRLADEFDGQVATLIRAAQHAMERLDSSSLRLGLSADSNRTLSGELETLAEMLTGETERAGAATGALTSSIRQIDQEVGQTSEVAQSILIHAERAQAAVADSERKAADVELVIGVIDEIARQTRLLALNATIEAARAGPVGRGFGVVASEIKSLSSRTGGSTKDVRRQVGGIQQGIGRIVEVTTQLGGLIGSMNNVASRVAMVSADQVRSTDEIDERIGAIRTRTEALVQASAAIRSSAIDNQGLVTELRLAGSALHESLAVLGRDAQAFTGYLRAS